MKKIAFVFAAFLTALAVYAFIHQPKPVSAFDATAYKAKTTIRCGVDWEALSYILEEADIPPMPGAGTHHWKISTGSDSAQFYFNQGINMYYGFHVIEAMASFKKAARFDAQSPMLWWAQALAYGPNINDFGYAVSPEALAATQKALALSAKAAPAERALIAAMALRYSADSTQTREKLNGNYTDAMKAAYQKFPAVADVAVLYADALMLQHPWDLWTADGTPKPWTPLTQSVLEKALAKWPSHPGANHYYIHVMEASPQAAKASASAGRLGSLLPGLSHAVHMPSHIYLRTGRFNAAVNVNEESVKQYQTSVALFPAAQGGVFLYQWHNLHMQANCALLAGRYRDARQTAAALQAVVDTSLLSLPAPVGAVVQYIYATPVLVNVRFERWDSLLAMPAPAGNHVYASLLYRFGRGMALAAKGQTAAAKAEAQELQTLMRNEELTIPAKPFSAAIEGASCAHEMLQGFTALREGKTDESILHFRQAAQREEAMVYNEPRDWLLNPKQYLGAAYLKAKRYAEAEQAFRADFKVNNQNVWSLYGLWKALEAQGKTAQAAAVKKQFDKAAEKSDVAFSSLIFQ